MLPVLALLAPAPPLGTTTATVLGEWLTQATGVPHAIGGELRDYPLFLSVRSGEPGRIAALVARALAGEWIQDGATLRLLPTPLKRDEGLEEFARGWKAAVAARPALAQLPAREVYAMRPGELLRFGFPANAYFKPLPEALRKRVAASEEPTAEIYLCRYANGRFATKVATPDERKGVFSVGSEIAFRDLPPPVAAALGDEAKKTALSPEDVAAFGKLAQDFRQRIDPKAIDRTDPLARFVDPVLKPLAAVLKQDLVVALPDFTMMGLVEKRATTVEGVLGAFSACDDWTMADGALVGRLPVSERRTRAQTRRSVVASFVRRTQDVGVPSAAAMADYLAGQRPQASESWVDVMTLVLSGVTIDQTHIGDFPYNLRLGAALTDADWARLRAGGTLTSGELSGGARRALTTLLVQSRERMTSDGTDPVRWPGFPNLPLTLAAKVEEEDVVLGLRAGATDIMTLDDAAFGYARQRAELGSEPLYRPGHRRKLTLTIQGPGEDQSVETGFADVSVDNAAKSTPWKELPPAMRTAFEAALKRQAEARPAPVRGGPGNAPPR